MLQLGDPMVLTHRVTVNAVLEPFHNGFEMHQAALENLDAIDVGAPVPGRARAEPAQTLDQRPQAAIPSWLAVCSGHIEPSPTSSG